MFIYSTLFLCVCVSACVRACMCMISFMPPHISRTPNYRCIWIHHNTEKPFIILIFAKYALFLKLRHHFLPQMPPTNLSPKYRYQRNPCNVGMTLLFMILTKNASFKVMVYLLASFKRIFGIYLSIYMYTYLVHLGKN